MPNPKALRVRNLRRVRKLSIVELIVMALWEEIDSLLVKSIVLGFHEQSKRSCLIHKVELVGSEERMNQMTSGFFFVFGFVDDVLDDFLWRLFC